MKTKQMILCALFAALVAIGGFLKIPLPVIPCTMQLFFATMAGLLLGSRLGALSVLVYVLLGLCGVPVFTAGGGPSYVLYPTFGYLIGFIFGTYLTGKICWAAEEPSYKRIIAASFAGLGLVYIFGTAYCGIILNFVNHQATGIKTLILTYFLPVIPGNVVLLFLGVYVAKRLIPVVKRYGIVSVGSAKK